ncbi:hypothetical protein CKM354_001169000 [Cercospora kikuchii]|uniref:BTB domain-containing protein n=1 Tax=Cercospora kikuchii TaxID=84275 RepID=A0A9P3CTH5_9PEZI|nr:uncharacterized protein CKM354_001169000 [Cercospora kikuchii]GIZ48638.1 hypothetical protein CKM354_001169000 [Cercospora kikuchii]
MAPPDRSTGGTLKRIYESGEWSDLTISTATRDFRVHKNIVCPACPFFEAALTRDFQEAHTGVVKLPESAETVDGMLRFIYGFDVGQATVEHAAGTNIEHLRECVDLYVASDKYDLPELRKITRRSVITYVRCANKVNKMVDAGLYMYQQTRGTMEDSIIENVVFVTARNLPNIRKSQSAWQKLVSHEEYLIAVMDVVFRTADWGPLDDASGPLVEHDQVEECNRMIDALHARKAYT